MIIERARRIAVLSVVCWAACGPDLNVAAKDPGNLTGVWMGTFTDGDDTSLFVVWLEQDGESLFGVTEFVGQAPERAEAVDQARECNIKSGGFIKGVASFKIPTEQGVDLLFKLAYDRQNELLEGKWGAETDLVDRTGAVKLSRVSWLPLRKVADSQYGFLGCAPWPIPQCADGVDNDGDGLTDADDPDCAIYQTEDASLPLCSNGYDDDGDGLTDLEDPNCHGNPIGTRESGGMCDDGLDNDGDGLIDQEEAGCSKGYLYNESGDYTPYYWPHVENDCTDGQDNDGDGATDEDDRNCIWEVNGAEFERPPVSYGEDWLPCSNGIDDDGDGLIDDDDPGCDIPPPDGFYDVKFEGTPPCLDGLDNDGDGLIDFEDPNCIHPLSASEHSTCANGLDDDGDGLVDLADPGCFGDPHAEEVRPECSDGTDNDHDGLTDDEDTHCTSAHDPTEAAACSDQLDNDGDGLFDMADPGCADPEDDDET